MVTNVINTKRKTQVQCAKKQCYNVRDLPLTLLTQKSIVWALVLDFDVRDSNLVLVLDLGISSSSGVIIAAAWIFDFSDVRGGEISDAACLGTDCRTAPYQLTEVFQPASTPWLSQFGLTASQWTEHYMILTQESFGELLTVIVSVRHRHASQHWFLQGVVVVSDPNGPGHTVRCFPCHDVVSARVTLRSGNGNNTTRSIL